MPCHIRILPACATPKLELQRTWVFVVGLLEWKNAGSYASFPKTDRRDAQLVALLKRRGVPADHVVYLHDREATRLAGATKPGRQRAPAIRP